MDRKQFLRAFSQAEVIPVTITISTLADGASHSQDYFPEGIPPGTIVLVSSAGLPPGVILSGTCVSQDEIRVTLSNLSGSSVSGGTYSLLVVALSPTEEAEKAEPIPGPPDAFPYVDPGYLSVLPGVAGPGMDTPAGTGRHLETPATSVYFINSLDNVSTGAALTGLGPNVFGGTVEWCRRATASPKVIIPLVAGWAVLQKSLPLQTGTPPRPGYVTEAYHFAPYPGLWLRGAKVSLNGASDVAVWHLRSYMGDDSTGLSAANRDPMGSGYDGGVVDHVVGINCELAWSCDELLDMYYSHDQSTLLSCAFINPLHESSLNPSEDHGFGPMFGGGSQCGIMATLRCLWANSTDRNPFTNAEKTLHANNLHYNHGRPGGGAGYGVRFVNQAATAAELGNLFWNGFVRGPENDANIVAVATTATLPAGSHAYLEGNVPHGWTYADQGSLLASSISGFRVDQPIVEAYPAGWDTSSLLFWHRNPNSATQSEWLKFVGVVGDQVGAQPGWRTAERGKVDSVLSAIRSTIQGSMPGPQFSDSVADEGGWFEVPEVEAIDPTNPGDHWWAPFPITDRDARVPGDFIWPDQPWVPAPFRGTNAQVEDQVTGDRRTVLECWIICQHWYVLSKDTRPPEPDPPDPPEGDWADVYVTADQLEGALTVPGEVVGIRGEALSDFRPRLTSGNGATLQYLEDASFDGQEPAIQMTPPTASPGGDAAYASILDTQVGIGPTSTGIAQMNFRWLAYYGATYHDNAPNAKVCGFILGDDPTDDATFNSRAGVFDNKLSGYQVFAVTAETVQSYYNPPSGYHPGDGPVANLLAQFGDTTNHANSPPRIGQEWVCFEMVVDARRDRGNSDGMNRLVMTTRDGTTRELVIPLDHDEGWNFDNNCVGIFEGLGFYFNNAGTADSDNYVRWSHCAFAMDMDHDELIGPPPGFLT